tara:strand:- start:487 stop:741 length:255 start_codon:yes stop_codon:yes gene_type:complete
VTESVKLAISKGLDIGIIGAPSILKVPQLLKLINSQSAECLAFLSYFLESGAYLISLSYNVTGFRSACMAGQRLSWCKISRSQV